jgi:hypothetical protein
LATYHVAFCEATEHFSTNQKYRHSNIPSQLLLLLNVTTAEDDL